jgi:class 3 adenylate cyclase
LQIPPETHDRKNLRVELNNARAREEATREILDLLIQSRDDEYPVFDAVLRNATRLCNAPIAGLFLVDSERKKYKLMASWGAKAEFVEAMNENPPDLDPERFAAARAMVEQRVVHVEDLASPTLYGAEAAHRITTIQTEGIRTALFVPLIWNKQSIGGFGVWRREVSPFSADEIALVETFATQAVIAIENVRQFKALKALNAELGERVNAQVGQIERMGRLKRFLPAAVADTVVSSGSEDMLKSHRALLGVLFCDIRGFTAFCETAEPEETIDVLQTYHEEMGKLINAHNAGVDHRMGDGIMVLFNDPVPCEDPAGDAVRLALAMRERMKQLCKGWKRFGHRLGFGVGVSLGYATVGMVGFEGRSDYTASGTAINLGSRLCETAEDGDILLSARAAIAVEDQFPTVSAGEVTLKGIREPVEVFRLGNYFSI